MGAAVRTRINVPTLHLTKTSLVSVSLPILKELTLFFSPVLVCARQDSAAIHRDGADNGYL